ncbi:MAG TPA: hypothetical protein VFR24_25405 [Candidatus Angelobacter sp.]|nr:hypothetical protein [Candidatus Angelobacter sp.]
MKIPPAGETPDRACLIGPANCYTVSSPCQESASASDSPYSGAILLVNFNPVHQDALANGRRRLKFVIADTNMLRDARDDELRQLDVVLFDVTKISNDIWALFRRICRMQKKDGLPLLAGAWSREYHPWTIHRMIEPFGLNVTYSRDSQAAAHAIELLQAYRKELATRGPQFLISHRLWQAGTICTHGEMVAKIEIIHNAKAFLVALSTRLMLLFDYLARWRHTPQSLSQIAAGLTADEFARNHGAYVNAQEFLGKALSRTAVKQQLFRLRDALEVAFQKAGLAIDPDRVLVAEETEGNEARYRLKISVDYQHISH